MERRFSVNCRVSVEVFKGASYITQRIICDTVCNVGAFLNVSLLKELRTSMQWQGTAAKLILNLGKKEQLEFKEQHIQKGALSRRRLRT